MMKIWLLLGLILVVNGDLMTRIRRISKRSPQYSSYWWQTSRQQQQQPSSQYSYTGSYIPGQSSASGAYPTQGAIAQLGSTWQYPGAESSSYWQNPGQSSCYSNCLGASVRQCCPSGGQTGGSSCGGQCLQPYFNSCRKPCETNWGYNPGFGGQNYGYPGGSGYEQNLQPYGK